VAEISTIGLDIAKQTFQPHGANCVSSENHTSETDWILFGSAAVSGALEPVEATSSYGLTCGTTCR
jgi:hypothetical protein